MLFTACMGVWMLTENRKRDRVAISEEVVDEVGFTDRTDLENKGFRYKL